VEELRDEQQQLLQQELSEQYDDERRNDQERAAVLTNAICEHPTQLSRNALLFLPCIHWALPNWDRDPCLPERFVNTLMWMESCIVSVSIGRREPAMPMPAMLDDDNDVDVDVDVVQHTNERRKDALI
jgi:hypothetical protein